MKNENEKLIQQVLNTTILKFTNGQKSLDLLLGKQRQILDKYGNGFKENMQLHSKGKHPWVKFILGSNLLRNHIWKK